jgi:hypothetical protein
MELQETVIPFFITYPYLIQKIISNKFAQPNNCIYIATN